MKTGKAKRYLAAVALLTGGLTVGAIVSPIGLAGAQSDDTTADGLAETESDPSEESEGGHVHRHTHRHRHGDGGARLETLSGIIGLDEDELREQLGEGLSLAEIAEAQGVDTTALTDALVAEIEEHLAEAVSDGSIDQETADERLAGAEERVEDFIQRTPGERGERGPGRHGHHRGGHVPLTELESVLGLSGDDIRGALADGQTLAEIAEGVGVSSDELVAALVAAASDRIDEAVADDRIDSDKAEELKAELEERVTTMIDAELGDRRSHHRFGRRGLGAGSPTDGDVQESVFTA